LKNSFATKGLREGAYVFFMLGDDLGEDVGEGVEEGGLD
jgi:hypothetical protein